nr:PLP-dependent aminotransferase family protein [uncultured Holophaga sp.]
MIQFSQNAAMLRTSEIRDLMSLATRPDMISFAGGMPGNELFPVEEVDEIFRTLPMDLKRTAFQYGPTPGFPPLLAVLKEFLRAKGLPVDTNELMITTGSLQAINILAKVFIDPGDTVLTENPCFIGAISAFQSFQGRLQGFDMDGDGILLDPLKAWLEAPREKDPKFLYLTPNFHNPAGLLYSEQRKRDLVELLKPHQLPLIEDDAYCELFFDEEAERIVKPMKALYDQELPICYTGSFSKVLGPGFRLGWMLAPKAVYEKCELVKQSDDACSPTFTQVLAYEFVRSGRIQPYIARMRQEYRRRRDTMVSAIRRYFPEEILWQEPRGGFYIWCACPARIDLLATVKACIEKGAVFVMGGTFDPKGTDKHHFRLAYSHTPEEKLEKGIQIIGEVLKAALAR